MRVRKPFVGSQASADAVWRFNANSRQSAQPRTCAASRIRGDRAGVNDHAEAFVHRGVGQPREACGEDFPLGAGEERFYFAFSQF